MVARRHEGGFSLVELLVVFVIAAILFVFSIINLKTPQTNATVASSLDTLLADIKSEQSQAMLGGTGGLGSAQNYGLYIQPNQYTIFAGSTYSAVNSTNFVISMPTGATLSSTLPSSQLIFTKGSGEVQGFVSGSNTITATTGSTTKTITIDRFGALTVN